MKKGFITLTATLFALYGTMQAQVLYPEVMSSFGGHASNTNVQLTYTAGEPLYETVQNGNSILTQGFNQTVVVIAVTNVVEVQGYDITAYPNPTQSIVTVIIQKSTHPLTLQLVDIQGQCMLQRSNINDNQTIDMSNFANGMYLLHLSDQTQTVKTFQIQKIR